MNGPAPAGGSGGGSAGSDRGSSHGRNPERQAAGTAATVSTATHPPARRAPRWQRFDTLALRLLVLMWGALVLSHVVAFLAVTRMLPPPEAPAGMAPGPWPGRDRARPPSAAPEAAAEAAADAAPSGAPGPFGSSRPPAPAHRPGGPPGPPPSPAGERPSLPPVTFGSLPPTPGVPAVGTGGTVPPSLPASALALDYGVRLLVIALAAWWGSRWVARPMARLADAAHALGGTLARGHRPVPIDEAAGTSEVRAVASVFNRMAAQIARLFESRSLMMASISHDLRTPLTRMRMRVEVAELPPALRERCIQDLAEMNALIDSLLDFFRLGSGAGGPAQRIDVAALLQALADDHVEQGHAVCTTLPAPPLVLSSDALALRRIVDNLVGNALRYAGSAEIVLQAVEGGVRIEVLDRGPGIPPERLEDVLHPFVRLEASRNRGTGGAGLGLAIANELAQALGGRLLLANRAGGGLIAQLQLPARSPR